MEYPVVNLEFHSFRCQRHSYILKLVRAECAMLTAGGKEQQGISSLTEDMIAT